MKNLRILLAENHEIVRKGTKALINEQDDLEVVGEAKDGEEAVEMAQQLSPDIVLMGISMPNLNGLTATKRLKNTLPEIKILILTRYTENGYIQQLIQAGINGYILKQSPPSELINAIRAVGEGRNYLDSMITQTLMNSYARQMHGEQGVIGTEITEREEEILRLIARGYSNQKIAERLYISVKTVETHKAHAIQKIGINDRIDIVNYAIFRGWMKDD